MSDQFSSKQIYWTLKKLLDLLFVDELDQEGVQQKLKSEVVESEKGNSGINDSSSSSGSNYLYSQVTHNIRNIYDYFIFCYISMCSEQDIFNHVLEYFKQHNTNKVHTRIIVFLELWVNHNSTVIKYDEEVQGQFLDMLIEISKPDVQKSKWVHAQLDNLLRRVEDILATNIELEENQQKDILIKHLPADGILDTFVDYSYSMMQRDQIIILAQQICLYEQFLLFQLDNRTVMNHKKYPNKFIAPQIQFFDSLNNLSCLLVYFAQYYDKEQPAFKNRIRVIEHLIDLTFYLKLYNNFSSSYSLYLSIQTIKFLFPGVCEYINIIQQRKLKKLDNSFSSQQNLALLQNNSPLPAVPYIGICFSQIARLNEIYKDTNRKVNIKRLEEQTIILKNLDQFKHFKYDFEVQAQIYSYLQSLPKVDATRVISSLK